MLGGVTDLDYQREIGSLLLSGAGRGMSGTQGLFGATYSGDKVVKG